MNLNIVASGVRIGSSPHKPKQIQLNCIGAGLLTEKSMRGPWKFPSIARKRLDQNKTNAKMFAITPIAPTVKMSAVVR